MEVISKFFKDIFYEDGLGYVSLLKNWDISLSKEQYSELEENLDGTAFFDIPFKFHKFLNIAKQCIANTEEDIYFSINNFMRKRETKSIWRLNCFALDFDFYKIQKYENMSPESFYYHILKPQLPLEPNYVINSGKGLYIIFNIYDAPPKQCINIYKAIYKQLIKNLIQYGADTKATLVTQVIRVPGTINSKNGNEVTIIEHNNIKYAFRTFINLLPYTKDQYLTYQKKINTHKVKLRKRTINSKQFKENTKKLLNDFKLLIKIRNQENIIDGYRELLIYLARERLRFSNYQLVDELRIVENLNSMFKYPLTDKEVHRNANPSELPNPTSKDTIISKLELTEEEMNQMSYLRTHKINVKLSQKTKRKLQKQISILKKTEKTQKRLKNIFEAIENNPKITKTELSKQFSVSERQIYRDLKYIKEHKSLFIINKITFPQENCEKVIFIKKNNSIKEHKKEEDP